MELLSEFLGGLKDFSKGEIYGLLDAYGGAVRRETDHYLIFNTEDPFRILRRITFSRRIGRIIEDVTSIKSQEKKFAIREKIGKGRESLINQTAKTIKGKVDLDNPDITYFIYNLDSPIITELLYERRISSILDPRYRSRPMNHPSSISPLIARGMINVAGLKEGDSFLDPFAGTGTYLIEGFRMGITGYGIDRNLKMVKGGNQNLKFFSYPENIVQGDFSGMTSYERLKAIVTDPPYGRGSKVFSQSRTFLYEKFFSLLSESPYRKVFCLPDEDLFKLAENFMDLKLVAKLRVHSSLTRLILSSVF